MRYIELLTESRSKALSEEQFYTLLPQFSEALKQTPIFRGIERRPAPFLITDTTNTERRAANTTNHVNLLVSNSDLWDDFPPRNQSLSCTTDFTMAASYGEVYRVLPKNGATIGVCQNSDFWDSFKNLHKHDLDVSDLSFSLDELHISNRSYVAMLSELDVLGEEIRNEGKHVPLYIRSIVDDFLKTDMTFSEYLDEFLNPYKNGFKLTHSGNFNLSSNHEVWMTGPCLLMESRLYESASSGASSAGSIATVVGGLGAGFDNDYSKSIYGPQPVIRRGEPPKKKKKKKDQS